MTTFRPYGCRYHWDRLWLAFRLFTIAMTDSASLDSCAALRVIRYIYYILL